MKSILNYYAQNSSFTEEIIKNSSFFRKSSFEDADIIIPDEIPFGETNKKNIQKKLDSLKECSKLVLVFLVSDSSENFNIPKNVILFRTSINKSKRKRNENLLPYLWDFFEDEVAPLKKTEKPIVGFCGNIKNNLGKRLSTIKAFEKKTNITSNFILRTQFQAGDPSNLTFKDDFKKNILNSHFTICNRGRGNFAIRLYQTLSLGRIPILLETDTLLPFEEEIDWSKHLILAKTEKKLIEEVENWWANKSEAEIIQIQIENQMLFNTYLKPLTFSTHLATKLNWYLNNPQIEIQQNFWQRLLKL